MLIVATTIMVVNTGGASQSPVHPFTVQEVLIRVPNWWCKRGHKPTSTGFCGIHGALQKVGMTLYHFCFVIMLIMSARVVINLVNVDVTSYVMANMAKKVILANKL
jgi:hypothetical protein